MTACFLAVTHGAVVPLLSKPLNIRWCWTETLVTHSEIVEVKEEDIFVLK